MNGTFTVKDGALTAYSGNDTVITVDEGIVAIENSTFKGCTSLKEIILPSTLRKIGFFAFENCTSLTSITVPEGVRSILNNAFYGCTALSEVSLPSTLSMLSTSLFYGCTSLRSLVLPEGLRFIAFSALSNVLGLTELVIPSTVQEIGNGAFSSCTALKRIYWEARQPRLDEGIFSGIAHDFEIIFSGSGDEARAIFSPYTERCESVSGDYHHSTSSHFSYQVYDKTVTPLSSSAKEPFTCRVFCRADGAALVLTPPAKNG